MLVGIIDCDVAGWCVIMLNNVQLDVLSLVLALCALLVVAVGVAGCRSPVRCQWLVMT